MFMVLRIRKCMTLILWWIAVVIEGKKVSGNFKLSGVNSEKLLASYALSPLGGHLRVNFTTEHSKWYEGEENLRLHLFRDLEWSQFTKALTCRDKIQVSVQAHSISFVYHNNKKAWVSVISIPITSARGDGLLEPKDIAYRPHYWYVVVDDCSLEEGYQRDHLIPGVHYELVFVNNIGIKANGAMVQTHLSANEVGLMSLHFVSLVLSSLVILFLLWHMEYYFWFFSSFFTSSRQNNAQNRRHHHQPRSVHAAVLWVLVAATFDAVSSLMEIAHLRIYSTNGIGSYWADALSAHFEGLCDSAVVILLLAIAAGWTLPSDIILVNPQESLVQRLATDLARPLSKLSSATFIAILILGFHVSLVLWGRTYDTDFESYHDLEHLPGRLLMAFRIFCGLLLVICTVQTSNKCTVIHLKPFYSKIAIVGLIWLLSLPLLSFFSSVFVPYYLRRPVVFYGAALSQSSALFLFSWLVTSHSSTYHKFSHIADPAAHSNEASLTEALHSSAKKSNAINSPVFDDDLEPRTWKLGKAKVRLD